MTTLTELETELNNFRKALLSEPWPVMEQVFRLFDRYAAECKKLAEVKELACLVYMTSKCKDGSHQDALKSLYEYFRKETPPQLTEKQNG